MKACPLTFSHPSEAQQLDGIGPNICDRLTKKLEEHCKANGLPMPKKGKRKRHAGEELSEDILEGDTSAPVKKPRKKKPYVPALRSGAYALVLALSSVPEDSLQSLSKAELQILAQPHCDSSFTVPSEANKFYTAWSSMKTLVEKDLVQEKGRPTRKYHLSDEGWEVARRIKAVQAGNTGESAVKNVAQDVIYKPSTKAPATKPSSKSVSEEFLGLNHDDGREATVPIQHQKVQQRSSESTEASSMLGGRRLGAKPDDQYGTFSPSQAQEMNSKARSSIVDLLSSPEPDMPELCPAYTHSKQLSTNGSLEKASSKPAPTKSWATQPLHVTHSSERVNAISSETPCLPSFGSIPLAPGTFTVQLVLDTREVRTKSDRDYIHDELVKKGVKPLVRALELGDFFWVAKMNDSSVLARYGEAGEHSDELALDWIVERKRLDDLVGSITDGRFSEQKFRLKKSGVKNVIYLIEEFSLSTEKSTHFHEAIQSSIASTQVVNGYFVKKTQRLDDTIRYIARMTRLLKDLYESKPLYLIPTNVIEEDNHLPLLQHLRTDPIHRSRSYHLTYPTFAAVSSKTDNLTLRDVFIKMLMCTRGVSADKALALQRIWSTPRALIEAFEACATEKERDSLVASKMEGLVGRAKIQRTLSQKVASIWGEE